MVCGMPPRWVIEGGGGGNWEATGVGCILQDSDELQNMEEAYMSFATPTGLRSGAH